MTSCAELFSLLAVPRGGGLLRFSTAMLPRRASIRVGKDSSERPAVLLETSVGSVAAVNPPFELRHLSYLPAANCEISGTDGTTKRTFAVVRCKSEDRPVQDLFLTVADSWVAMLGPRPSCEEVGAAFEQLAELFEQLALPARGTVRGLWGEVLLIAASSDPERLCRAWHTDPRELYDFVDGAEVVEVKTCGSVSRAHQFSLAQLSPPAGSRLVIASVIALEGVPGASLREVVAAAKSRLPNRLALRVESVVAATLGRDWEDAARVRFRTGPALDSISFFDWADVPAVGRDLPAEVSEVRFRSDLDAVAPLDTHVLTHQGDLLAAAVPSASSSIPGFERR